MTDREVLKEYLWQYSSAKKYKKTLERRLKEFREEMGSVKAMRYSDMPKGSSSNFDGPAVSEVIRSIEIEEKIEAQKKECQRTILNVMKMMDFLSVSDKEQELERKIIEARHIDGLSWRETSEAVALSRTPCIHKYNDGLDRLLSFKKVRDTVTMYRDMLDDINKRT